MEAPPEGVATPSIQHLVHQLEGKTWDEGRMYTIQEYRSCSKIQFQDLTTTVLKSDEVLSDSTQKSYDIIRALETNNRREFFRVKQTTLYVQKKQHINELNSGEKHERIQKSRDTNTRLLRAEALAGAARMTLSSLTLSCSLPLQTFPKSPAVHILILHAHSHFASPAVLLQSSPLCTIIVAQKIARYRSIFKRHPEIARSMYARKRRSARRYKTVALLAHAILP